MKSVARFILGLIAMPFEDQILAKRHRIKHVELYDVSADELDQIEQVAGTVGTDLQFSTFWIPIAITTLLTLLLVPIQSQRVFVTYLCVSLIGFGFGIYFGFRWWLNRGQLKKCIEKIRERQIGPIGEEGKELKPSDLAALPSGAPPPPPTQENR